MSGNSESVSPNWRLERWEMPEFVALATSKGECVYRGSVVDVDIYESVYESGLFVLVHPVWQTHQTNALIGFTVGMINGERFDGDYPKLEVHPSSSVKGAAEALEACRTIANGWKLKKEFFLPNNSNDHS